MIDSITEVALGRPLVPDRVKHAVERKIFPSEVSTSDFYRNNADPRLESASLPTVHV
jgi:hypothetical protein